MKLLDLNQQVIIIDIPAVIHRTGGLVQSNPFVDVTLFGYSLGATAMYGRKLIRMHEYFVAKHYGDVNLQADNAFVIEWEKPYGLSWLQGELDLIGPGNQRYIDGCTDSLLVCPPRLGLPCLNALYFPPFTTQTFHTHPSFRAGCVAWGLGTADHKEHGRMVEQRMSVGDVFYIPAEEQHRFRTGAQGMTVVAFHPDSDFGPTDEDHPMINRTIISHDEALVAR